MFNVTRHDFGTLAMGAKAEFEFVFTNLYVEDVHVAGVRSTCGCTVVRVDNPTLKTYQRGAIIASINTLAFRGPRSATVTVTFDKPFYAEVQLHTACYIRSDVVFQPGSVQFGCVDQGTPVEKKVAVSYAGRDDWQVLDVQSANPHLTGKLVQTRRGGGLVGYDLLVRLDPKTPPGLLNERLILVTNDQHLKHVPIGVEGRVEAALTVSPVSVFLGVLRPGQRVSRQLVVRGKRPFRILSITSDGAGFEFDASGQRVAKTLHLIPLSYVAGDDHGKVSHTIRIETDLGDCAATLSVYAEVLP